MAITFRNINELAETISAEQFELFLRAYVKRQLKNAAKNVSHVSFFSSVMIDRHEWCITATTAKYHDTRTEGELLELCALESHRRQCADSANKLLMLESSAE